MNIQNYLKYLTIVVLNISCMSFSMQPLSTQPQTNHVVDLAKAVCDGLEGMVKHILDAKVDPNSVVVCKQGCKDVAPLHIAAFRGHTNIANLLLQAKANINQRDELGRTPLHWAAGRSSAFCNTKIVDFLLVNKADIDAKSKSGRSALDFALDQNQFGVARILFRKAKAPCSPYAQYMLFQLMVKKNSQSLRSYLDYLLEENHQIQHGRIEGHKAGAVAAATHHAAEAAAVPVANSITASSSSLSSSSSSSSSAHPVSKSSSSTLSSPSIELRVNSALNRPLALSAAEELAKEDSSSLNATRPWSPSSVLSWESDNKIVSHAPAAAAAGASTSVSIPSTESSSSSSSSSSTTYYGANATNQYPSASSTTSPSITAEDVSSDYSIPPFDLDLALKEYYRNNSTNTTTPAASSSSTLVETSSLSSSMDSSSSSSSSTNPKRALTDLATSEDHPSKKQKTDGTKFDSATQRIENELSSSSSSSSKSSTKLSAEDYSTDDNEPATQASAWSATASSTAAASGKEKNQFTCNLCSNSYRAKHNLQRHIKTKHENKTYPCHYHNCGEKFLYSSVLKNHIETKHINQLSATQCERCGQECNTKDDLNKHLSKVHKIRQ